MFKFERDNLDFPFYDNDSFLSLSNIIVILATMIIILASVLINMGYNKIIFLATPIVALLYITRGKLGFVYKKFVSNDAEVILICWLLYLIITANVVTILISLGVPHTSNAIIHQKWDMLNTIIFVVQLFSEEIIRFLPFILTLSVVYKFSDNRKLAMIIALIVSSAYFGLIHITAYGNLLFALISIGISSMFLTLAYLKTKNLLVSYITHLLVDITCILLALMFHSMILV